MRFSGLVRLASALSIASLLTAFAPAQSFPSQTPASIQSFQLTAANSGKSGWLLAGNRLFWTDTLGAQWSEITPAAAASSSISGVYFRPDGNGWLLESSSASFAIAHTTDNGAHWTSHAIPSPFTADFLPNGRNSTYFTDAQHGFVMLGQQSGSAFRLGILLRTTDGGATWQQAPTPPVGGNITFTDATHGFDGPGPQGDELYSTADAGNTWQRITLPSSAALTNVNSTIALPVFTDATDGALLRTYATDGGTTIVSYATSDGGATWSIASTTQASTPAIAALAANGTAIGHITASAAVAGLPSVGASVNLAPVRSSFSNDSNGWVEFKSGSCVNGTCTQTDSLRATLDGGKTYISLGQISGIQLEKTTTFTAPTRSTTPTSFLTPHDVTPDSSTVYNTSGVMGFDACSLPTVAQMTDWYANSPYRVAGIYIGGDNFACRSGLGSLTKSYVSTILAQGWQIEALWVGLQGAGACKSGCSNYSTNSTTANQQGVTEADSAVAAMIALGLGQGSTIVYDMEAYTRGGANTTASQAFLKGWTTELHAKGYISSVYSSHPEFTDWYPTVVTPAIDIIWFAYFFDEPGDACGSTCQTVFPTQSSFDISTSYWLNNHRARQTSAGFEQKYGSTTIDIDEDWIDASMVTATPTLLTVATAGVGATGSVASTTITNPNSDSTVYTAISCGATCTASFAPTDTVTLVATAGANSKFSSWTGCTTTSSNTCTVLVATAKTVTATFAPNYGLTVTKAGTGTGTVTSADSTINCGTTCSATYTSTTTETLTATPAAGSTFTSWTGCTTAIGPVCTVAVSATGSAAVTATFTGPVPLTVTKAGTGTGTVTSADSSINCGSTCTNTYAVGTVVTLTATPSTGSIFTSWTGCTPTTGNSCTVTMAAAESVTANFTATAFTAALTSPSMTITAGQSGANTVTFTPTGNYTGTFSSFSCTGLSSTVGTCSFSATTLTATGNNAPLTTTLTIATSAVTAQLQTHATSRIAFAGLLLPAFLLPFALRRKNRNTRMSNLLLIAFAVATLGLTPLLSGCGGSSSPAPNNTPVFSGTIQVNYTASTNTTASQLPLQLTVNR